MGMKPYLPAIPLDDDYLKVTAIETVHPKAFFPGLLLLRIHTEDGIIGHGETYYCAEAVQSMIHDWMGRRIHQ